MEILLVASKKHISKFLKNLFTSLFTENGLITTTNGRRNYLNNFSKLIQRWIHLQILARLYTMPGVKYTPTKFFKSLFQKNVLALDGISAIVVENCAPELALMIDNEKR